MSHQPNLCDADYHWSSAAKRNFLEELSMTGSVSEACRVVGKSRRAAYNLRTRKGGRGFRIGWDAAMLAARVIVQDILLERAIDGQQSISSRDVEGNRTVRHSYDNRMTLGLLTRLDKYADTLQPRWSDMGFAQIACQELDGFFDLVEAGTSDAALADWFAAREPLEWVVERFQLMRKGPDEEAAALEDDIAELEEELAWQKSDACRRLEAQAGDYEHDYEPDYERDYGRDYEIKSMAGLAHPNSAQHCELRQKSAESLSFGKQLRHRVPDTRTHFASSVPVAKSGLA